MMYKIACISALMMFVLSGCLAPLPSETIRVTVYQSQPIRPPQDTSALKDFSQPLSVATVAVAGALTGESIVLPLVAALGAHVAVRGIERTSDAEFKRATIDVPVPPLGTVVLIVQPDGSLTVARSSEPTAPLATPLLGTEPLHNTQQLDLDKLLESVEPARESILGPQ